MTSEAARRWRLLLGSESERALGALNPEDFARDSALERLYGGGLRKAGGGRGGRGEGAAAALDWIGEIRRIFPKSAAESLEREALERHRLVGLLSDPGVLERVEATPAMLRTLLAFQGERLPPETLELLRAVVRRVIAEILARMRSDFERAFAGRRERFRRGLVPRAADFNPRETIRRNLRHWDSERGRLIAEDLRFHARSRGRLPWRIVLCVDQSGSMADSLIHAAVTAAILCGLPGIETKLVLFNHEVLDLSDRLADPLDLLTSLRMGGGTNIAQALAYCEALIGDPNRTILILVTDFCEGGSVRDLERVTARLVESRVRLLGLTALDQGGEPFYDRKIAGRLADLGMKIGAMTPDHLAQWLAEKVG